MVNVAVVFHSGCGHTAVIAEAVARGVEKLEGAVVKLIPVDAIDQHYSYLENDADAVIFSSPTYVGSVSAQFKAFMDASTKQWGRWRDKLRPASRYLHRKAATSSSTLHQLAAQHHLVWV
nr:flavodoxin family protein [Burkholderia stagnalis]